jgi:sialic acid synthase SpsE
VLEITLGTTRVAKDTAPYVIAEIGVNHEGSLEKAKELIELAKEGGAHAAKFQTYKAEKIASKDSPAYWDLSMEPTTNQFQLFKKHDKFGDQEYLACAEHAEKVGIDFLSTPFDADAVDFLDPLMPFYKIASADLTNIPFLRQIASKKKPVVLSTGASTLAEIDIAVHELQTHGCADIVLLQCILNYPTEYQNAHLNMMNGIHRAYPDLIYGLSDHTLADKEMLVLTTAYIKGGRVIEKHFTHDKTIPGSDHKHSMDVDDLKKFTQNVQFVSGLLGDTFKAPLPTETPARENARRSIVLAKSVKSGQVLKEEDITFKRPAHGVSPLHWDQVIGMVAVRDLDDDHVLQWQDIAQSPS